MSIAATHIYVLYKTCPHDGPGSTGNWRSDFSVMRCSDRTAIGHHKTSRLPSGASLPLSRGTSAPHNPSFDEGESSAIPLQLGTGASVALRHVIEYLDTDTFTAFCSKAPLRQRIICPRRAGVRTFPAAEYIQPPPWPKYDDPSGASFGSDLRTVCDPRSYQPTVYQYCPASEFRRQPRRNVHGPRRHRPRHGPTKLLRWRQIRPSQFIPP